SRIAFFCGDSSLLLAIKNLQTVVIILHQFEGLHNLWDSPLRSSIRQSYTTYMSDNIQQFKNILGFFKHGFEERIPNRQEH
ncbi:MAG: hypothetical protein ACK5LL_07965, partial [Suipraeoptans sp.]